jgi:hypothetical protein
MPWFKVDDLFPDHPKVLALGDDAPDAIACWLLSGTWSARHLTDGRVPRSVLKTMPMTAADADRAANALVRVGLWEPDGDDAWRIHDWADYQPTRAAVEARREVRAYAGRLGGLRSGEVRREATGKQGASTTDEANPKQMASPRSNPRTRPVPDPSSKNSSPRSPLPEAGASKKNGAATSAPTSPVVHDGPIPKATHVRPDPITGKWSSDQADPT